MSNENTNTKMNKVPENKRSFSVGDFMSLRVMLLKLRMKHFQRIFIPVIKTLRKPPKSNTKIQPLAAVAERFLSLPKEPDCKKPRSFKIGAFLVYFNARLLGAFSIRLMFVQCFGLLFFSQYIHAPFAFSNHCQHLFIS
jgi:hypothetical protein